jgi:hypothetical protein
VPSQGVESCCLAAEMSDQKILGCCQSLSAPDQWPSMNIRSPLHSLVQMMPMEFPQAAGNMSSARRASDMAKVKKG